MAQQSQGHQEELRKRVMQYALDEFLANGIRNVHVYTMNKPEVAAGIRSNVSAILK